MEYAATVAPEHVRNICETVDILGVVFCDQFDSVPAGTSTRSPGGVLFSEEQNTASGNGQLQLKDDDFAAQLQQTEGRGDVVRVAWCIRQASGQVQRDVRMEGGVHLASWATTSSPLPPLSLAHSHSRALRTGMQQGGWLQSEGSHLQRISSSDRMPAVSERSE